MYAKILIETKMKVLTGMHIGGSAAYSAIGAVDSPVIRDPLSNLPVVPGSSLKGKLRTLLARSIEGKITAMPPFDRDDERVKKLFGSSNPVRASRLQFADAFPIDPASFDAIGGLTEVKTENSIKRDTAVANPRQIERVVAGAEFAVRIVYDMENSDEFREDMESLAMAMKLLQLDYLGGHGSRGSGRVSFQDIRLSVAYSDAPVELHDIQELFSEVQAYELLSI